MSSCADFTKTNPNCRTVTIIEPDDIALSLISSGSTDQSLDESGDTQLLQGQDTVQVAFDTPKASDNYRFEHLYVDALGAEPAPGDVEPVPVTQTTYGFVVKLAGAPLGTGYVLRWRVIVTETTLTPGVVDAPESLREQLIPGLAYHAAYFVNPRSGTDYGFSELRVENLVDPRDTQRHILPQVTQKTTAFVMVGLSTVPNTANYYLVLRTP